MPPDALRPRWRCVLLVALVCGAWVTDGAAQRQREGLHGRIDSGFNLLFGTNDVLQFTLRTDIAKESRRFEFSFANRLWYGFREGERQINYGTETLKFDYLPRGTWSPFVFVTHAYDEFRRIRGRFNPGGGLKYTFLLNERMDVSLSEALLYEYENIRNQGVTKDARSSERFKLLAKLTPTTNLSLVVFHQPRFGALLRDFRVVEEFAFTVDITAHVALKVVFNYEYDSRPPRAIERHFGSQDTQLTFRF